MKIGRERLHLELFCNEKTMQCFFKVRDGAGNCPFDQKDNTICGLRINLTESLSNNEISIASYKVFEDPYNGIMNINIFCPFVSLKFNFQNKFLINQKNEIYTGPYIYNKIQDCIREHYENLKHEMLSL